MVLNGVKKRCIYSSKLKSSVREYSLKVTLRADPLFYFYGFMLTNYLFGLIQSNKIGGQQCSDTSPVSEDSLVQTIDHSVYMKGLELLIIVNHPNNYSSTF